MDIVSSDTQYVGRELHSEFDDRGVLDQSFESFWEACPMGRKGVSDLAVQNGE